MYMCMWAEQRDWILFRMRIHSSKVIVFELVQQVWKYANALYLACMVFGLLFVCFFNRFSAIYSGFDYVVDLYPLIQTFINAH